MSKEWEDVPESEKSWEDVVEAEQLPVRDPKMAALLGAGAGTVAKLGKMGINKATKAVKAAPSVEVSAAPAEFANAAPVKPTATQGNWAKSLTGVDLPNAQMDQATLKRAQEMSRVIGPGGELAGGEIRNGILLGPEIKKAAAAPAADMGKMRAAVESAKGYAAPVLEKAAPVLQKVNQVGQYLGTGVPGKVLSAVNPILGAAGAFGNYEDYKQRMEHGDKLRGYLSLLGAAGSAASTIPHPLTRGLGTALGLGAPALNYLIDKTYGREGYATGGLVYLADGGLAYRIK